MFYSLKKEDFNKYIKDISKGMNVIAPVKDEIVRYQYVNDTKNIVFQQSPYPVTILLFGKEQTIFEYYNGKVKVPRERRKKTICLLPHCDVLAFYVLDKLFLEEPVDQIYKIVRDSLVLVEFEESEISEYDFSKQLFFEDNHDAKIIETPSCYIINIETNKGKHLMSKYLKKIKKQPKEKRLMRTVLTDIEFKHGKNEKIFEKHSKNCIACGACTLTCPTCACYLVRDEISLKTKNTGRRFRRENSCQFLDFSEVAGGYRFRTSIPDRMRYRIYHKFPDFKKTFGVTMCVGCGRCTLNCPADIKLIDILKDLEKK